MPDSRITPAMQEVINQHGRALIKGICALCMVREGRTAREFIVPGTPMKKIKGESPKRTFDAKIHYPCEERYIEEAKAMHKDIQWPQDATLGVVRVRIVAEYPRVLIKFTIADMGAFSNGFMEERT